MTERMNRSINERARCLKFDAGLPKSFWAEVVSIACYLINRSPRALLGGKVTEEVWTGKLIDLGNLKIFGCPAYVHISSDERSKLDPKSKKYIFIGYVKGVKGYKFWDPVAKKIVINRDAVFDEQFILQQKDKSHVLADDENSSNLKVVQVNLEPQVLENERAESSSLKPSSSTSGEE